MKLSEIKSALDEGIKLNSLNIQIKSYLPITDKMIMVLGYDYENIHQTGIIDECIEYNRSFAVINYFMKDVSIKLSLINFYTDIEIDDIENMTQYDVIMSYRIWQYVKNHIDTNEYSNLMSFIDDSLNEKIKSINSFEAIISNGFNEIINKLPTDYQVKSLARTLVRDLNSMDTSKFPMLKELKEVLEKKNK